MDIDLNDQCPRPFSGGTDETRTRGLRRNGQTLGFIPLDFIESFVVLRSLKSLQCSSGVHRWAHRQAYDLPLSLINDK